MTSPTLPFRHCERSETISQFQPVRMQDSEPATLIGKGARDQRDCAVGRESRQITHVAKPEAWTGTRSLMGCSVFIAGTAPAPRRQSYGCPVTVRRDALAADPLGRSWRSLRGPGGAAAILLLLPVRIPDKGPARLRRRLQPPRNDVGYVCWSWVHRGPSPSIAPAELWLSGHRPSRRAGDRPCRSARNALADAVAHAVLHLFLRAEVFLIHHEPLQLRHVAHAGIAAEPVRDGCLAYLE